MDPNSFGGTFLQLISSRVVFLPSPNEITTTQNLQLIAQNGGRIVKWLHQPTISSKAAVAQN
jgi:hypothetical protein